MDTTTALTNALRQSGLRLTAQRIAICQVLAASKKHPTALAIYEVVRPRFTTLSLATVYNTIQALVKIGAVNELGGAGDGTAHYDADLSPHINLACISCHQVVDLPSTFIESVEREVEAKSGYRLLGARVMYYGLCPTCIQQQSTGQLSN